LGVVVKLPGQEGVFTRSVSLLVDDDGIRRVSFRVTGRIRNDAGHAPVAASGQ
jgi:hypothetical protein